MIGCTTATPEYTLDAAFKAQAGKPAEARKFADAKLCLYLTENADKAFEYANRSSTRTVSGAFAPEWFTFNAKQAVADLTEMANARFRDFARLSSFQANRSSQCDVTLALDVKFELAFGSSPSLIAMGAQDGNKVFLQGVLYDSKGSQVDSLASSSKAGGFGFAGGPLQKVWERALAELASKLDASAKLAGYVAALPRFEAVAAIAPGAIDMAFWDSVKNSSNPADFQAYLQKFPSGSFATLARTRLTAFGETVPVRLTPLAAPAAGTVNFGDYHALVIGIDNYRGVTPLNTAVRDATTVSALLRSEYGFKVALLVDPTRNEILDAFDDLRRRLTEKDNLLIYFAGHGHLEYLAHVDNAGIGSQ